MPKISVVIPVYNGSKYIEETLNSVLNQSYKDFEIIVIDDGSTDNTSEIVNRFPSPVRLIQNKHNGKSFSRNIGIRAARGELISFVDADDLWMPNKLEVQIEYLKNHPEFEWIYSDCYIFEGSSEHIVDIWSRTAKKIYSGNILKQLLNDCLIPSPTPMVSRRIFDDVGFFDETFLRHQPEDWDMWLRIASRYPIGSINEPLALLRKHENSLTAKEDPLKTFEGIMYVVQRAISRDKERIGNLANKVLSSRYLSFGKGLARMSGRREARTMYFNALRYNPLNIKAYTFYLLQFLPDKIVFRLHKLNVFLRNIVAKRSVKKF